LYCAKKNLYLPPWELPTEKAERKCPVTFPNWL